MAELNVQELDEKGSAVKFVEASEEGDQFQNEGKIVLKIRNNEEDGRKAKKVKLAAIKECSAGVKHEFEITIPAGELVEVSKLLDKEIFSNRKFNNMVDIDYSDAENLEIAVVKLK